MTLVHTTDQHPWPPHPFLIPELRDPITKTLTFRDFVACARVCRLWHHVFNPYVWHTLSGSKRFPDDFTRQGRHVRALVEVSTAQADLLVDRMREHCLYLESVQLTWHGFYEDQFEMFFLGIKPEVKSRARPALRPKPTSLRQPTNATAGVGTLNTATRAMTATNQKQEGPPLPSWRSEGSSPCPSKTGTTASSPPLLSIEMIQQQVAMRARPVMEQDLIRTKLSPDALSVIARAAGRTIPKAEPKKALIDRHRAMDNALQSNAEDGSVDTLMVQGYSTDKARLLDLPGTIPDSPNGFLSNTLHTLILQVHHETIVAILLWLTRAGLQGRLQGLRQFEISAHESMSIMTSKGKRYVPVPASTASNQVHAGVLHDFWAVFPGLEVCALHAVQITDDQTEIPDKSSRPQGSPELTTRLGGANTSGALTTQQAYQIKRGHIARCGRHPGYLSEVVSTLATIYRLTSQDPSLGISTVTQLHLKECDSLSSFRTLLSRLPHLTHLSVQRLQSSEQLQVLTELCPKLSHFSYMGQPERSPTTALEWGAFFKATASTLQELLLQNVQVTDQDLRVLARRCGATLRVLSVVQGSNTTACSWQGTKAVLENCRVLESCTLSCYGPIDGLFVHDPEFKAVQEDEEEEEEEGNEEGVVQGSKAWACRETLQTLCLYGLVLYNAATNHRLFERLCTLRRLRVLTITGRGMSLEALLGPQRLVGSASVESASQALEAPTTITTTTTPTTKSMYPCLESIDLPRLTKKLTSEDLLALLQALPRLRWMDVGGAYEMEALIWLETERRDLLTTFSR
ncbi:hypothetical protein BGZ52_003011, partial [Haplosporangium bisporale]